MLLKSKHIQKLDGKRVKPHKFIKKATFNLNNSVLKGWTWFKKRKLRVLYIREKALVLVERLKKKDTPGKLYKSTTENRPFLIGTEYLQ